MWPAGENWLRDRTMQKKIVALQKNIKLVPDIHGCLFFQNLDVNLAVNNLLSRDEDDGDDDENPEYLPGGDLFRVDITLA